MVGLGTGNHARTRMYPGVSSRRPDKAVARRPLEEERLEWWRSLSSREQLEQLDKRLGKGTGAKRQRIRLENLMKEPKKAAIQPPSKEVQEAPTRPTMKAKDRRRAEQRKKD